MTNESYIRASTNKLKETTLLVEADYRYPQAWIEIDSEEVIQLEMME